MAATESYALSKIKTLRAENAKLYDTGKFVTEEMRFKDELPRLQEMNQNLVRAKRPEKDLVKDVEGFTVPEITDPHIKKLMSEDGLAPDVGQTR